MIDFLSLPTSTGKELPRQPGVSLMATEVYAALNYGVIVSSGSMISSINPHGRARRGFEFQLRFFAALFFTFAFGQH
jgi:hypothetical protein